MHAKFLRKRFLMAACATLFQWRIHPPAIHLTIQPPTKRVMRPLTCTHALTRRSHVVWSSPWMREYQLQRERFLCLTSKWMKPPQRGAGESEICCCCRGRKRRMQNALCGLIKNRPAAAVRRRNAKSCKLTPPALLKPRKFRSLVCVRANAFLNVGRCGLYFQRHRDAILIGPVSRPWSLTYFPSVSLLGKYLIYASKDFTKTTQARWINSNNK